MLTPTPVAIGGAFALVSALLVARSRRAALVPVLPPLRPTILLFGDSITQQSFGPGGWGAALANTYQRTADVCLRGYSGYNTRWALRVLPRVFPAGQGAAPALVTVMLGANDANIPAPIKGQAAAASRQFVPLEEYVANLRLIMRAVAHTGCARLLLITPPPVDTAAWHTTCVRDYGVPSDADPNRSFEFTREYAEAVVQLGKETGTPTLDLHAAFLARPDWRECLRDGLHPNAAGGGLIGEAVLGAIVQHYPELQPAYFGNDGPERLAMDFPDHKEIDVDGIDESFGAYERKTLPARTAFADKSEARRGAVKRA